MTELSKKYLMSNERLSLSALFSITESLIMDKDVLPLEAYARQVKAPFRFAMIDDTVLIEQGIFAINDNHLGLIKLRLSNANMFVLSELIRFYLQAYLVNDISKERAIEYLTFIFNQRKRISPEELFSQIKHVKNLSKGELFQSLHNCEEFLNLLLDEEKFWHWFNNYVSPHNDKHIFKESEKAEMLKVIENIFQVLHYNYL